MVGRIAPIEFGMVNRRGKNPEIRGAQNPVDAVAIPLTLPCGESSFLCGAGWLADSKGIDEAIPD